MGYKGRKIEKTTFDIVKELQRLGLERKAIMTLGDISSATYDKIRRCETYEDFKSLNEELKLKRRNAKTDNNEILEEVSSEIYNLHTRLIDGQAYVRLEDLFKILNHCKTIEKDFE